MARNSWLSRVLADLPDGSRVLDAGAGEMANRAYCNHLEYVSQDFCQYKPANELDHGGFHTEDWDTSEIDLISDITSIPEVSESFDAVICTEVLEHVPHPERVLDELARLIRPGGKLIITAPFSSLVHMAPYYFSTGFSRFWYEYHLPLRNLAIIELTPNGNWYSVLNQEISRLGSLDKRNGYWGWPISYFVSMLTILYLKLGKRQAYEDLACFGWHCVAEKHTDSGLEIERQHPIE